MTTPDPVMKLVDIITAQTKQIARLQAGIKKIEEWEGNHYQDTLIGVGILAEKDMEP